MATKIAWIQANTSSIGQTNIAWHTGLSGSNFAIGNGTNPGKLLHVIRTTYAHILGGKHAMPAREVIACIMVKRANHRKLIGDHGLFGIKFGNIKAWNFRTDGFPQASIFYRGIGLHIVHIHMAGAAIEPNKNH